MPENILTYLLVASWQAFLPLLALSFLLSYWYLAKHLPDNTDTSTTKLRDTIQSHSDNLHNDENGQSMDYMMGSLPNKWLAFGGNFYGLVALYTYLIVEYQQLAEFFNTFISIDDMLSSINSTMIKEQIKQAFVNFYQAFAWPATWLEQLDSKEQHLIWLGAAYLGFIIGMKAALYYRQKRVVG